MLIFLAVCNCISNILRFTGIVCLNIFHIIGLFVYKRNLSGSSLDLSFCVRETRTIFVTVSLLRTRNERSKPEPLRVSLVNEQA